MIRRDSLSDALTILAVAIGLYLSTFDLGVLNIFLVILPLAGFGLQIYTFKREQVEAEPINRKYVRDVGFYTLVGVAALYGAGLISPLVDKLPFLAQTRLSTTTAYLLVTVIAIGEEQFFRGFFANWLQLKTKFVLAAVFGSAAIFAAFHFAVYGASSSSLFYVLASGVILSWIGFYSGRLTTCMFIHLLNNIMAYSMSVMGAA